MGLREADALSGGFYGPNAVGVFCTLQSKAVNGICVRASTDTDYTQPKPALLHIEMDTNSEYRKDIVNTQTFQNFLNNSFLL